MGFNQDVIWLLGVVILAYFSFRKEALSGFGALVSTVIGGVITLAFSLYGLILLAAFFLSSTILGRLLQKKDKTREDFAEKGEKRDGKQVFANGGWSAIAAFLFLVSDDNPAWFLAFVASLAAANSDTWASTVGKRSKRSPKMVLTGKVVSSGQSGGTTFIGNVGAITGSTFIVLTAIIFHFLSDIGSIHWLIWILIIIVGVVSQWIDALAGAIFQALYYCDQCRRHTEKKSHCGQQTRLVKGLNWIDNDVVNHLCTFSAFIVGGVIGIYVYF